MFEITGCLFKFQKFFLALVESSFVFPSRQREQRGEQLLGLCHFVLDEFVLYLHFFDNLFVFFYLGLLALLSLQ